MGGGGNGLAPQINMQDLEKSKEELTMHFIEEVKVKKRIHELEQKMESAAMSLLAKKNEIQQIIKEKGKDSVQIKIINEEIDETNGLIRELKTQLDNNNTKMISLIKRRDAFQQDWR